MQLFINDLESSEDLSAKTLTQYASDLRHLANWYEHSWHRHQEEEIHFVPNEITTPTLIHY
ncbi:site-specific integrase [Natribacillus halophilus]|uniref:site-specific integrase n=1 Tax=Natribacillus halophilus TaxID=549003 RepID=UPI000B872600